MFTEKTEKELNKKEQREGKILFKQMLGINEEDPNVESVQVKIICRNDKIQLENL